MKGTKGKPLTESEKRANRNKSRIRARMEHVFATMGQMAADRIRTIGIGRAARGITLKNLVYKLLRLA